MQINAAGVCAGFESVVPPVSTTGPGVGAGVVGSTVGAGVCTGVVGSGVVGSGVGMGASGSSHTLAGTSAVAPSELI